MAKKGIQAEQNRYRGILTAALMTDDNTDNLTFCEEQIAALAEYDYPGNVRELLNLLERATVLDEMDFKALLNEHREMNAGLLDGGDGNCGALTPLNDDLELATRAHVRRVFDKYGQNLSRAAGALKVSRNTVRKYL